MFDFDAHEKRVRQLFHFKRSPRVNKETLKIYLDYLDTKLEMPCSLTGIEDFDWEEYYIIGPGDKEEYEKLKKTKPSYTDIFELVCFDSTIDEHYGILVKVKRISDKKIFVLPLADLKTKDKDSKNYQLIDDFAAWFVNNR